MAVNKNFKIQNGLEVSTDLIFADAAQNKVGIATTTLTHTLTVSGDISATGIVSTTNALVNNQLTLKGPLTIGSTTGIDGAYLVSTGTGVTWASLPGLRSTQTFTATASQTIFNFSYNPAAGVDVYVNGVRLSSSEYTATNGTTIVLDDACFVGDTVDLVAYSVSGLGAGVTGITGLTVLDEGVSVGNDGNIVSLNFIGAGITASATGFGVTITLTAGNWNTNINNDFYTNELVGISTDDPQYNLDVHGDINFTGDFYQNGSLFVASRWTAGSGTTIYRDSFVGIGSTLPQKTLDVGGDINFSGNLFQGGSAFVASRWTAGIGDSIYKLNGFVGLGTTNPTQTLDVNGDIRLRGDLYSAENNVGTAGSILYTAGSGSGTYWGPPVGAQGTSGAQGDPGTQGSSGAQGVQGLSNQGVQGTLGVQGDSGVQGDVGSQGVQGVQGLSNQGVQGSGGSQGSSGAQGVQGVQGLSNQGVQGSGGSQGSSGSQGVQGVQGLSNQGVQGEIGSQGSSGAQGVQGVQGLSNQGVQGTLGAQGDVGSQGVQGVQGTLGAQGIQGLQGLQGTQGTFGPATIPQTSVGVAYTVLSTDNGKHISVTGTSSTVTVPVGLGFTAGDNVVIFNDSTSNQSINAGVGITMYLAGTASTGNRTLYQRGIATILCVSANRYVISGAGLT